MSKYEPNAKKYQEVAAEMGFKLSWAARGSKIYMTAKVIEAGEIRTVIFRNYVQTWYPKSYITSWGADGSETFFVRDIWEELKINSFNNLNKSVDQ